MVRLRLLKRTTACRFSRLSFSVFRFILPFELVPLIDPLPTLFSSVKLSSFLPQPPSPSHLDPISGDLPCPCQCWIKSYPDGHISTSALCLQAWTSLVFIWLETISLRACQSSPSPHHVTQARDTPHHPPAGRLCPATALLPVNAHYQRNSPRDIQQCRLRGLRLLSRRYLHQYPCRIYQQ